MGRYITDGIYMPRALHEIPTSRCMYLRVTKKQLSPRIPAVSGRRRCLERSLGGRHLQLHVGGLGGSRRDRGRGRRGRRGAHLHDADHGKAGDVHRDDGEKEIHDADQREQECPRALVRPPHRVRRAWPLWQGVCGVTKSNDVAMLRSAMKSTIRT